MLIFHLNTNDKGKYNVGVEKVNIISMINTQIVKYLHKSVSLKQKIGGGVQTSLLSKNNAKTEKLGY